MGEADFFRVENQLELTVGTGNVSRPESGDFYYSIGSPGGNNVSDVGYNRQNNAGTKLGRQKTLLGAMGFTIWLRTWPTIGPLLQ